MKNFIEVKNRYTNRPTLINVSQIEQVYQSQLERNVSVKIISSNSELDCSESYEEVKKLIVDSQTDF